MVAQMIDNYRMAKDFQSLVYLSMALQAEGIRYGVEHWRRHMHRAAGRFTGSSTTAGRLPRGPAWTTSAAGRRCTTPPAATTYPSCSRSTIAVHRSIFMSRQTCRAVGGTVRWSLETVAGEVVEQGEDAFTLRLSPIRSCAYSTSRSTPATRPAASRSLSASCGKATNWSPQRSAPSSLTSTWSWLIHNCV